MAEKKHLSIVVPVYNEASNLHPLHERLTIMAEGTGISYEIILVNDGSHDNSLNIIQELAQKDENVKYINFSRNFGHQVAFYAGMVHAKGQAIVTMDGDLQDPPEFIPELYKKLQEGYKVVYAKRRTRKGVSPLKKLAYKLFYRILVRITSVKIPLDTGDFRIVDRQVIKTLTQMPEQEKFLRGQIAWLGFPQAFLEYDRDARHSGKPAYTYGKLFKLALDGITSFSNVPLKIASISGFVVSAISFLWMLRALYVRLLSDKEVPGGWTSLMIAVLFLGGIQLISIGIIGEYLSRMNTNIRNRPLFIVEETNIK